MNNEFYKLKSVSELVEIAGKMPGATVLIPGGDRSEDIKLVEAAFDSGIINKAVLIGNAEQIQKHISEHTIKPEQCEIVDVQGDEQIGQKTVELVNAGGIDIVLKGGISTPIINRAMLKIAVKPTVSLASIFDAAPIAHGRPIVLTDAGVTTVCTYDRLVDIINNAADVARIVMGIDIPKVAILAANEKQISSLPSTKMGMELAKHDFKDLLVCGPLSFDLATDPESVRIKGIPNNPNADEVAGYADILVCPGIDSANILYKTLASLVKYGDASMAGITMGFKVPYVILSRADSLEIRLDSVAMCSVYAQRTKNK